jgi:hypothetical protein
MKTDHLTQYIDEELSAGVLKEELTTSLIDAGWTQSDIDAGFVNALQQRNSNGSVKKGRLPLILSVLIIVLALGSIFFGTYYYLTKTVFENSPADSEIDQEITTNEGGRHKTDDMTRLEDLVYWTGLVEQYHKKTGRYPLQEELEKDEMILVRIANEQQQQYFDPISILYNKKYDQVTSNTFMPYSTEVFVQELERVLGPLDKIPFDPDYEMRNTLNWYNYFATEDGYLMWVTCVSCGVTKISTLLLDGVTPTVNIVSEGMAGKVTKALQRDEMMQHPIFIDWVSRDVNKLPSDLDLQVAPKGFDKILIGSHRKEIESVIGSTERRELFSDLLDVIHVIYPDDGLSLVYDVTDDLLVGMIFYSDHEKVTRDVTKPFTGTFESKVTFESSPEEIVQMYGDPISVSNDHNYFSAIRYEDIVFNFFSNELTSIEIIDPYTYTKYRFPATKKKTPLTYNPPVTKQGWGEVALGARKEVVESILGTEMVRTCRYASRPDICISYSESDNTIERIFISDTYLEGLNKIQAVPELGFENDLSLYEATLEDVLSLYGDPDSRMDSHRSFRVNLYYENISFEIADNYISSMTIQNTR